MQPSSPELSSAPGSTVWAWVKGLVAGLLLVGWAVGAHVAASAQAQGQPMPWGALLALAPMCAAAVVALLALPARWLGWLSIVVLSAALVWAWPWLNQRVALIFYLEHSGIYLLLAIVFGRTLWGSGEPLVTQLARRVHGGVLSVRQVDYTRKVTQLWSLFFMAMVLVSTTLFLLAPVPVWSTFANLISGPLVALLFVGEFAWRRVALAGEDQSSFSDAIRAWKAHNAGKSR